VETTSTDGGTDSTRTTGGNGKTTTLERNSNGSGTRDLDESGSRTHELTGYDGTSPSRLLMEFRETFLNIDLQVIQSLDILFMGLWM
jgi:hypothetical protein